MITRLERRDKAAVHHRCDDSWKRWGYEVTIGQPAVAGRTTITFIPQSLDRRSLPLVGNCWSIAMLVIDGFTASGFLPGVRGVVSEIRLGEPVVAGFDGLIVEVADIA